MIVWFQFEREDGTYLLESDPLKTLPSLSCKYNTVTLPASQCLFFRGENDAGMQTAARIVVKADGYQVTVWVAHPDRLIGLPLNFCPVSNAERDPMKRLSRLVSR